MSKIDEYYLTVLRLVKEAGSIVREKINQPKDPMIKSCEVDLVTEWDQKVEKLLVEGISSKYADHKFIGEEESSLGKKIELTDEPTWIIDPIDGTMNFVHGLPHTCISIALLINKVAEIGIVYNPILEQLFTARKGQGAFLNGAPIQVSEVTELRKALVMMEMGTSRDPEKMKIVLENANNLTPKVHGIRALGSAALNMCMVALGGADVSFEFGIHAWDIAAGDIIVREAGGVCIDPAGGPFDVMSRRVLCATTMDLAQELAKVLVQYYPERD
ncbi:inositol monophosphatase 1-like [Hylaeus anthracinus]|uniref:inositol monophosphatase 1-like n=1 Tax=Hylaeus volcanicus TaxID=313075 RepID=UPI0023B791CA|nr:inositol monophosphatase 1-like [Hylaeus volcanicus]XP_054013347.1 inositol monophosphatase 1-like [Hylaeus anthracinus]